MPEKFGAAEALRIGLVSAVVPDDELAGFVGEKAARAFLEKRAPRFTGR